jgi:hypothetical protein
MSGLEGQPAPRPDAESVLGRWRRRILSAVRTLLLGALKVLGFVVVAFIIVALPSAGLDW